MVARPRRKAPAPSHAERIAHIIEFLPQKIRYSAWSVAADAGDAIRDLGNEIDRLNTENARLRVWLGELGHDELSVEQRLRADAICVRDARIEAER